jgi:hypothetical protein
MSSVDQDTDDILLERPERFNIVILATSDSAKDTLFPVQHQKLRKFTNIILASDLRDVEELTKSSSKRALFIEIEAQPVEALRKLIYGIHAENKGLVFGFTLTSIDSSIYERLIYAGFDDIFDVYSNSSVHARIYSWMRRFGANPILSRELIAGSTKKLGIGHWVIHVRDGAAHKNDGTKAKLTRQEIDFLSTLNHPPTNDDLWQQSYAKLFKAPHAIAHNIKRKLGADFPLCHDSSGKYYIEHC